ncbi:hypothetical protein E1211_24870 [Micromonospora sp. 15K316]|uniref:hypothetical protein n=1 Tax=Micromonospora sp. 15K316 TaxID=2530376 RepID=UPI0010E98807|nr:hypothetical protein [Micromonospora sp. 15K316]TDC30082.1 hypothetical protein E1211_24870 [Micromonospora sp. 15K316]
MTTRWEVESAIRASNIEPPGRHIVLTLLTLTVAATAEIPPAHAPTFTDMERETGLSRSALTEWMRALADGGWVARVAFPEESRPGFRLSIGDPNAARAPRSNRKPRSANPDAACRQAVRPELDSIPPGGMAHTAERYADVPPGGTTEAGHLFLDSPTGSQTRTNPEPAPASGPAGRSSAKKHASKTEEKPREDVERICKYLAEWIIRNGSRQPTISKEWRDEARRLIDRDKRPVEEIRDVIRWCQRDPFWRKNILSMPKFRQQYDRLRLGWEDDPDNTRRSSGPTNQPYRNQNDDEYTKWVSQ